MRGEPGSPHSWSGERQLAFVPSACSDSGTSSVLRSSRSFTSDQMTVPPLSIRNVPRCGAPFASLNTPYALAAAPCGQKSDANVYSAPSSRFHACRAGGRVARDEDDLGARLAERLEVLLEVARLVLADGRERERVEDEEDVRAPAEVGEPDALAVRHREVELGRDLHLSSPPSARSSPDPDGR